MSERIDIGAILSRVFQYYREQAGVLLPAALIIFVPIALIAGVAAAGGGIIAILGVLLVSAVANAFYQATVVEAVRDIQDGRRDLDVGGLFRSASQVLGPVIVAAILLGFGIAIGLVLLIVPGLILLTIWAVTIPAVVLERKSPVEALGRSRELVRGHGWQVFGVVVILAVAQEIARRILIAIFGGIGDFVGGAIGSLIGNVLFAPLTAIAATVLYLELRRIKEGTAPPAGADPLAPGTGTPAVPAGAPAPAGGTIEGVPGSTSAPPPSPPPPPPTPPPPAPGTPPPPPPPPPATG
ncbi:MAG: hypothetical protein QOE65_2121 [Solirubrobacteraceae bacterium]|jgi:hypothetical protein|nr:hypothetical protein [Solirubrobacteraceae bacterium]